MKLGYSKTQSHLRAHSLGLQVVDGYLDGATLAELYQALLPRTGIHFQYLFYFPVERVGEPAVTARLREYVGPLADLLIAHFVRLREVLPPLAPGALFELWTLNMGRSDDDRVVPHFDHLPGTIGAETLCPTWSTILHVGPVTGIVGGATAICCEQPVPDRVLSGLMRWQPAAEARALSRQWIDVPQRSNRLVIFDGSLPHFVEPVSEAPDGNRITLLVNVWDELPEGYGMLNECCRASPEEFRIYEKLDAAQLEALYGIAQTLEPAELATMLGVLGRLAQGGGG